MNLSATSWPSWRCVAATTTPIPPTPSTRSTRNLLLRISPGLTGSSVLIGAEKNSSLRARREREGVDVRLHPLAERAVHHLVLLDEALSLELRRHDRGLKMVLRAGEILHLDVCAREGRDEQLADA